MSRHIDLIAVGVLLLGFAFAAHVHDAVHMGQGHLRLMRIRTMNPVIVAPPAAPSVPHFPHFSHLPRV